MSTVTTTPPETHHAPARLALPPAPAPARPRMLFFGTALGVAAGAMLFAALIAVYMSLRQDAGGRTSEWLPEGVQFLQVAINTALIVMIGSSVLAQWAVYAMARADRRNAAIALGLTVVFGVAALNSLAFVTSHLEVGVADSVYGVLVLSTIGVLMVTMVVAIVFVGLVAFRTIGGRYSAKDVEGIAAAALFWHFTVAAFAAVWYFLFVLK